MDLPNLNLNLPDAADPDAWGASLDQILRAIDANFAVAKVDLNGVSQSSLSIGAFNKVLFSRALVDTQGWFDAANSRFKPTAPCLLLALLQTSVYDLGSGTMIRTGLPAIYKNGAACAYGTETNLNTGSISQGRGLAWDFVACDGVSDYIEGFVYAATGTGQIIGDAASTRMAVMRLK